MSRSSKFLRATDYRTRRTLSRRRTRSRSSWRAIGVGARRIEVASFVNPRRVPQMADGEDVIAGLPDDDRITYIGLCLNARGVERAIASRTRGRGIDQAGCVIVATDAFGIANQGQTSPKALPPTAR